MKKLLSLLVVGTVVMSASVVSAGEYSLFGFGQRATQPVSTAPAAFGPAFFHGTSAVAALAPTPTPMAQGVVLFQCVRYKDLDNIAPCAVPKIVMIKDPCACCDPCSCCKPMCVAVKICVPPCGCVKVSCNKDGSKVKYDYGKYEIEIKSKNGKVTVDYDD